MHRAVRIHHDINHSYVTLELLYYCGVTTYTGITYSSFFIVLQLHPSQSAVVSLVFTPCSPSNTVDILVFINNSLDQTEECFLVKTTYRSSL